MYSLGIRVERTKRKNKRIEAIEEKIKERLNKTVVQILNLK